MKRSPILLAVLAATGSFVSTTSPALAGVALYEVSYNLEFNETSDTPGVPGGQSIYGDTSVIGPLFSGVVQHFSVNDVAGGPQVLGAGQAVASYTALRAVVTAFPGGDGEISLNSDAAFEVSATDQITVNSPGLAGQTGTVRFSYEFDGSISGGDETAAASLLLFTLEAVEAEIVSGIGSFSETVSIDVPFVFGVPIYFQSILAGAVKDGDEFLGSTVDAFNTAAMDQITVFDSLGQSVEDVDVFGASGTSYNPFLSGPVVIPEPSRALLQVFCVGMTVLVLGRRRRGWASVC